LGKGKKGDFVDELEQSKILNLGWSLQIIARKKKFKKENVPNVRIKAKICIIMLTAKPV
jgi:hypothetical protein